MIKSMDLNDTATKWKSAYIRSRRLGGLIKRITRTQFDSAGWSLIDYGKEVKQSSMVQERKAITQSKPNERGKGKLKKYSMFFMILVLMVVTACSGGNNSTNNSTNNGTNNSTNTPNTSTNSGTNTGSEEPASNTPTYWSEEPATLSMMAYNHPSWPFNPEWDILDWHEENTNIRIEGFEYAGEFADAIGLTVASGETPDIIQFTGNTQAMQIGQMGALVDLSQHLDKMPNLAKFLDTYPTQRATGTSPEGAIYMANTQGVNIISVRGWLYREDVFNELGLSVPTNWQELYDVSKALKEAYPESYPFTFRGGVGQFATLAPSFNTWYDYYPDPATGKVKYGPVTDGYEEMLGWLNKFYEEGLMAPDWLSMTTAGWTEYMTTNKSFITVDYVLRIPTLESALKEVEADGKFSLMAPALGHPDGGMMNGNKTTIGNAIFTTTKNLDAALKYIDYLYSEQGQLTASWGKEGVTYEVLGGEKQYIPSAFENEEVTWSAANAQYGIGTNGMYGWVDGDAALSSYAEEYRPYFLEAADYSWDKDPIIPPNFSEVESEIISTIGNSILKHMEENSAMFVTGERDLGQFDNYVQEMDGIGLQQVVDLYTTGWERSQ